MSQLDERIKQSQSFNSCQLSFIRAETQCEWCEPLITRISPDIAVSDPLLWVVPARELLARIFPNAHVGPGSSLRGTFAATHEDNADRPHNNSYKTSELFDETSVWIYLFCSVACQKEEISIRFWWKTKCEVKQNTIVARSLTLDSLPLPNPVITHLSVDPSESRWPASGH
jgi:hypothetical protein